MDPKDTAAPLCNDASATNPAADPPPLGITADDAKSVDTLVLGGTNAGATNPDTPLGDAVSATNPAADPNTNINGNTRNTRNTRDTMEAYVTLEVSFNGGIDFTQSDLQFWYRPTPEVRSVLPMRGPASGGTSIIVTGIHFYTFF